LKAPLHVWRNSLFNAFCRKEKKKKPKWDTQNPDVIQQALKINKKKETKRQTKK
jgi:hypothetical protein